MKKLITFAVLAIIVAGTAVSGYLRARKAAEPEIATLEVSRGDIVEVVGATGTLEAVTTVDVGTQVNGVIKEIYVDFNSIVSQGQLVAKIDPANIEAAIERDTANLQTQTANLEVRKVALEDARNQLRRAENLYNRRLITLQELETAQVNEKTSFASFRAQEASIKQTEAQLNQDRVNLGYTNIHAPVDGIIINRKVDIGQTVVSNNAATSMFQIAEDLTRMRLKASIDESDVGLLRPGQPAIFRVDAYPEHEFLGKVEQIRLQPTVSQNVVTYVTMIEVPNDDLRLKPGMTANVKIEIRRIENVLRVPMAALRFRATQEIFEALNITPPADLQRKAGQSALKAPVAQVRNELPSSGIAERGATTIDALFGPLVFEESQGRVWVYAMDPATKARSLRAISVRTGITDGQWAHLVAGEGISEGMLLVSSIDTGQQTGPTRNASPFMQQQGGHGPGGFGGGHGPH